MEQSITTKAKARKPANLCKSRIPERNVDMNALNERIGKIQLLASQIAANPTDLKQLDKTLSSIRSECSDAGFIIEDAPSRIARYQFENWKSEKHIESDTITFRHLAMLMSLEMKYSWWEFKREFDELYALGLSSAVMKHGRPYANYETLAGWWEHRRKLEDCKQKTTGAA